MCYEFVIFLISVKYKAQMGLTMTVVMMTNSEVWVVMFSTKTGEQSSDRNANILIREELSSLCINVLVISDFVRPACSQIVNIGGEKEMQDFYSPFMMG